MTSLLVTIYKVVLSKHKTSTKQLTDSVDILKIVTPITLKKFFSVSTVKNLDSTYLSLPLIHGIIKRVPKFDKC